MLYAAINEQAWGTALSAGWDKTQDMFKYLKRMVFGYQLMFETRMIYSTTEPAIRCSLIKWTVEDGTRKREVLLETSDASQMEAALFMLVNEVEVGYKAALVPPSMVP